MSNKFDLERFKAGEPAYDEDGWEKIYLATSPNGEVVYWNVEYKMPGTLQIFQRDTWTMKPKEEWTVVAKANRYVLNQIYASKQEALDSMKGYIGSDYEAVKIIRE